MPTDTLQIAFEAIDKGLERQINQIDADLTKLERQIGSTNKSAGAFGLSADQIGSKMASAGKALTIGMTVPIAGLAVAATKAASDLNETSNKIETLFGNASGAVMKFAETASTSLGQSKKQALDAAADFAVFGKAAGLAGNDLVDFSKKNVQLAADMASFFNTSPEEAITAIGAAFRGESEPIRRYGVLINEASLKDQALRMGLIKTTTEALQPQQRVLAAQALILQQTTAAQGDFARTSDGLANQSRILNAQFQDTIAALGQGLLPIAVKVTGAANDLLTAFNNLDQPQKDLIVGFGLMAAAAGPVLTIGGKLVSVFGAMRGTAIDAVGGFVTFGKTIGETAGYLKTVGVSAESLKFAFQNLKASGALLGVELGVIIVGLIAIGKYLEEVGNAAKASNEDLIAMSRSGDVFKQAAATTEIFAHGQDRLKVALDATHEKIRAVAKDYADYKSSIEATAKSAGYEINAQGDLVQVFYGMGGRIEKVIEAHYRLTKAQYEAIPGAGALGQAFQLLVDKGKQFIDIVAPLSGGAIIPLAKSYGVLDDAINRAKTSAALSVTAFKDTTLTMDILKTSISGAVSKEVDNFSDKQDELKAKAKELQGAISTSYGRARDDAIKSLGEINTQLAGNAAAHEEATKRILYGYLEQEIARQNALKGISGYTDEQVKFLDQTAQAMGLKSAADVRAYGLIAQAAKLAATDQVGAQKLIDEALRGTTDLVQIYYDKLNSLPRDILIKIRTELSGETAVDIPNVGHPEGGAGTTAPTAPRAGTPARGGAGGIQAQYGANFIVPPNPRGGMGDYFPVLAAPGERVTVQTKAQQNAEPAALRGGDTYNYTTNVYNPLAAAMLADKQRRDRLARSNARMGVV